jgi:hypothetical protein
MDVGQIGPATPPDEAALWFYREAMRLFREKADPEEVQQLLDMAQACALVSIARYGTSG